MIIPEKISHKIILGAAILAQLAGYYLLALSFHYIGIDIKKPPSQVPTNQDIISSGFVYFYSICSFVISGAFVLILKGIEKRMSPYLISTFIAPSILLVIAYTLWVIATGTVKVF